MHPSNSVHRLFVLPISDPVTAMYLDNDCLSWGTIFGRIICFQFSSSLTSENKEKFIGTLKIFAGFSEDAVKMVYTANQTIYAILGNSMAVEWPLTSSNPSAQQIVHFDRRISSTVKHVLPFASQALIPSLGMLTFEIFGPVSQV